ncbi:MAG: hypothetical protein GY751_09980 [Bacteroidetes bacterium]|nr:hypothetical protein [Bacteroidota bacterium]
MRFFKLPVVMIPIFAGFFMVGMFSCDDEALQPAVITRYVEQQDIDFDINAEWDGINVAALTIQDAAITDDMVVVAYFQMSGGQDWYVLPWTYFDFYHDQTIYRAFTFTTGSISFYSYTTSGPGGYGGIIRIMYLIMERNDP